MLVHDKRFCLHVHLLEQKLTSQLHLSNSTTASGATGSTDKIGRYFPSCLPQPSLERSETFGCKILSCTQMYAWRLQDISHHRRFAVQDVSHPSSRRFAPVAVTTCPSLRRFVPPCETFRTHRRRFAPNVRRFASYVGRFAPY